MQKVLVLIENSRATIAELRSLKKINDIEIHLAANKKVFSDKIRYRKYIKPDNYYTYNNIENIEVFLLNLTKKIGPFTLMPNGESVLRNIVKSKEQLIENGIKISLPNTETYQLFSDKYTFAQICNKFEIKTPTETNIDLIQFKQKFVIKPKFLSNDPGVLDIPLLIENEESFLKLKNLEIDLNKHFIQKLIEGPSYYYCAAYFQGKKKAWFVQKNLHQQPNGKSIIKAIPYHLPPDLIKQIDSLMNNYDWDGVMMFELKECSDSGEMFAIECNPRFWGPLQLALDNGVDFVRTMVDPDYKCLNPADKKKGYIWRGGYFHGLFLKLKTKTSFQKFNHADKEITYKDVWGRKDTRLYFIIEPLLILVKEIHEMIAKKSS